MNDVVVAVVVWLIAFGWLVWRGLSGEVSGDEIREVQVMERVERGGRLIKDKGLLASCVLPTMVVVWVVRVSGWSVSRVERVVSLFVLAFYPMVTYLIAGMYVGVSEAVVAAGVVMAGFYFAYDPAHGRQNYGYSLGALVFYSVLNNWWVLAGVVMLLLMLSHYAAFFHMGVVLAGISVVGVITGMEWAYPLTVLLLFSCWAGYFWYMVVNRSAGAIIENFIYETWRSVITKLGLITDRQFINVRRYVHGVSKVIVDAKLNTKAKHRTLRNILDIAKSGSIARRVELLSGFTVVMLILYGLVLSYNVSLILFVVAFISTGTVAVALINPVVDSWSGAYRAYGATLPVLAVMFALTIREGIISFPFAAGVVAIHILATAGIVHRLFGVDKQGGVDKKVVRVGNATT